MIPTVSTAMPAVRTSVVHKIFLVCFLCIQAPIVALILRAGGRPDMGQLTVMMAATIVAAAICLAGLWWFLRPLRDLTQGIHLFRTEGYLPRLERHSDDEFALLSDTVSRLVGELDIALKKLKLQSSTDQLTGLANRRAMLERGGEELTRALRNRETLSVILFNIDRFRSINDDFGQEIGDYVLVAVGQILRDSVRPYDFAARISGEEFLLLLPRTSLDDAKAVAERLRRRLEITIVEPLPRGRVTASFGVAVSHADTGGLEDIISEADMALYESKKSGRNTVRVAERISLDHILQRR